MIESYIIEIGFKETASEEKRTNTKKSNLKFNVNISKGLFDFGYGYSTETSSEANILTNTIDLSSRETEQNKKIFEIEITFSRN